MNDRRAYPHDIVDVSRGVLVEVFALLSEHREHCVLVGGWAPYLLTEQHKPAGVEFTHIGSVDIDVALDFERLPKLEEVYEGIRRRLERAGFSPRLSQTGQPLEFSLEKLVEKNVIHVDFLAPMAGGTDSGHRHQRAQDLLALKSEGCEVAFRNKERLEVEALMPSRARHRAEMMVAGPAAVLTMKALAFAKDPSRVKDSYDICSVLRYYKQGPSSVATEAKPFHREMPVVREAAARLAELFAAMDSVGPVAYANFDVPERPGTEDWDLKRRQGLEAVRAFLGGLA